MPRAENPSRARWSAALTATATTLLVLAASTPAASTVRPRQAAPAEKLPASGTVQRVEVPMPALQGNRVGTPDRQAAAVYLPAGYPETTRALPALYLLHGIFDTHAVWLDFFGVPEILDRLIAAGELPPLIVVMPDGRNRYGGGYYRNSPVSGRWADAVAEDLVTFVDEAYRTLPGPESRAIVGHSMGGYGALHLAMERPDVFGVAWAMSPCCLAPVEDLGFGNASWRTAYGMEGQEDLEAAIERQDFYAVATIGILTAFFPDPDQAPFLVDFPFDVERGEIVLDQEAYADYLQRFPLYRLDERRDALAGLRGLALDYGVGDQFLHIPTATAEVSRTLAELRIPHLLDVYEGDHRQQLSERLESLVFPWVGRRLVTR